MLRVTRVRVPPRDQPEPDLTTEEERRLIASLRQMHTKLGHPSNHALARATRVTGGSAAAVRAALQLRCDVCESAASWTPLASETSHRRRVWCHSFWRTAKVDLRPRRRIRARVRDRSSKTWGANPCRQQPSLHSKTQSVSGTEGSGRHMRDDSLTCSASSLCIV